MATKTEPKVGSVLSNGFTVIEVTRDVVIAMSAPRNLSHWTEYAVWRLDGEGNTYSGYYSFTLAAAFANYSERCGNRA